MSIYFNGFNEQCASFKCADDCEVGFVTFEDGVIANAKDDFIGYCKNVRDGVATVQLEGYVEAENSSENIVLGYNELIAVDNMTIDVVQTKSNSNEGGDDSEDTDNVTTGNKYRVIMLDETNKKIGFLL